jgi:hypothetical protein
VHRRLETNSGASASVVEPLFQVDGHGVARGYALTEKDYEEVAALHERIGLRFRSNCFRLLRGAVSP